MVRLVLFLLVALGSLLPVSGVWAGVNSGGLTVSTDYVAQRQVVHNTRGEVTAVDGNIVTIKGEGFYDEIALVLRARTYLVKAEDGSEMAREELQVGDQVTAYYGSQASRSIPPQVQGQALIVGQAKLGRCLFYPVAQVKLEKDTASRGTYAVLTNLNRDLIATVTDFAYADYDEIAVGDNLLLWCEAVTLSLPARTNASKVLVLPKK